MHKTLPCLMLSAALAGCAHVAAPAMNERLALYRQHSGAPVDSFQLDRVAGMHDWTPLGDQALAVWSSDFVGHVLELRTRCPAMLTATRVWITNAPGQVGGVIGAAPAY